MQLRSRCFCLRLARGNSREFSVSGQVLITGQELTASQGIISQGRTADTVSLTDLNLKMYAVLGLPCRLYLGNTRTIAAITGN